MKLKPLLLLVVLILSLTPTTLPLPERVEAWWTGGHEILTFRAVQLMPEPWKTFLLYYSWLLVDASVYPDSIYKALDAANFPLLPTGNSIEEARHYIDLEIWTPKDPTTGLLSQAVEQYSLELVDSLKKGDLNQAFVNMGRLAHYVEDIHQPYHATANYDPKNKTGVGMHAVLDAAVEQNEKDIKFITTPPYELKPIANLTSFIFYITHQSNSFLKDVNRVLLEESKSWDPSLTKIIENRSNTAIYSLARVWYTAFVNAGWTPPTIPSPNKLSIQFVNPPTQIDPAKSMQLEFTIIDSVGVRVNAAISLSFGTSKLNANQKTGVYDPFGKYVAILPSAYLQNYAGSQTKISISAQREGYVAASAEAAVQVLGKATEPATQAQPVQPDLTMLAIGVAVVVAVVATGVVVARRKR